MNRNRFILFKLLIKNDLNKIIIWLASIIGINLLSAYAYPGLYNTEEAILNYASIMVNPAMKGLLGGAYPMDAYNLAVIFSQEILLFSAIAVSIMNIYFSIKFIKVAEEDGITEIVNSRPVSRYDYLSSSIVLILSINFIIFIGLALGLSMINLDGATTGSSFIYGLILALIGLLFSGIGFIATKLYNNSSSATTFSYLTLLSFYSIRAIGDVINDKISLLSPLGWLLKVQVFYKNNYLFIILLIILSICLYLFSFYLFKKVDYGSGVFNLNMGKRNASKSLKTGFGFILRLEKTQIFIWMFSLFILTASFGAIFSEFETFLEIDIIKQFFGSNTSDFSKTIIFYIIKIISLFGVVPSVVIILKLAKEENKKFNENIFVRNYSRVKYFLNHILFAVLLSVIMQIIIIGGVLITGSEFILDTMSYKTLFQISLSYLPAIWIILGIVSILYSLGYKYSKNIWIYFGFIFVSLYLEEILKLPKWIMNISSFYHVNTNELNLISSIIMIVISSILFTLSLIIYKKRDIN